MKLYVQELRIPAAMKQMMLDRGLEDLGELCDEGYYGPSPSMVILNFCGTRFGTEEWMSLVDCLLRKLELADQEQLEKSRYDRDLQAATIVQGLIARSTGDVGGLSQARLFAEITYDFLVAIENERDRRA